MAGDIWSAVLPWLEDGSWATDLSSTQGFHSSIFMMMYSVLSSIFQIPVTLLNVSVGGS